MSNCIIGLQYLVHVGDKFIRSACHYLSQSNGCINISFVDLSKFGYQFSCAQEWLPISKTACILHGTKGLRSILYDGVRLQGLCNRSSFCFYLSWHLSS